MAGTWCIILTLLTLGKAPEHCVIGEAPWFCHGLDCPPYEVQERLVKDVELRSYDAGVWMSTNVTGMNYEKAVRTGFMRLFAYISGSNAEKQRIDMTAPVRVELTPGAGPFCEDHYKVSFYVPFDLQDSPPLPLSQDVFVDPAPPAKYYVMSYGGYTNAQEILDKAMGLAQILEANKLEYDISSFFGAGYDSPFRLMNRHNEVWIRAQ